MYKNIQRIFLYAACILYVESINITDLMNQYMLLCGVDYFCDHSKLDIPIKPNLTYRDEFLCPDCRCDVLCLKRGDCCPDLFYSLPTQECVHTFIMNLNTLHKNKSKTHFQMIKSCPKEDVDISTKELCEKATGKDIIQELFNVPVTGEITHFTYRNKHCAICNGDHNFTEWNFDIECGLFADFNFFSSYEEIVEHARQRRCDIKYDPGEDLPVHSCQIATPDGIIDKCNVTGYWVYFNENIAKACESTYDLRYRHFKNVFCYMCNPSYHYKRSTIKTCDGTGVWLPKDDGLEMSCKFLPATEATRPFKNIFCYLCNKNNTAEGYYNDMLVNINEFQKYITGKRETYSYFIETVEYVMDYYAHQIFKNQSSVKNVADYGRSLRKLPSGQVINITNLVRHHFAAEGTYQYCDMSHVDHDHWFLPAYSRNCICNRQGLFSTKDATKPCIDMALMYPLECLSDQFMTREDFRLEELKVLATNGCFNYNTSDNVKKRCENSVTSDIYSLVPATDEMDKVVYKNLDCYLCGNNFQFYVKDDVHTNTVSSKPWNMKIKCDEILDFAHYVTLYDVLKNAESMQCRISFKPKVNESDPKLCDDRLRIRKCNISGYWTDYDEDLIWACEYLEDYVLLKTNVENINMFCQICNPKFTNASVISKCNVTGDWAYYSPAVDRACAIFPKVDNMFPYKNIFCALCNGPIGKHLSQGGRNQPRVDPPPPNIPEFEMKTYRNIFSLNQFDETEEKLTEACDNNQIYDYYAGLCRNVTCFPGKLLGNGTCNPLLKVTSNLRYTMAFAVEGQIHPVGQNSLNLLLKINSTIREMIQLNLNNATVNFETLHLLSNTKCIHESVFRGEKMTVKLLFYAIIFIDRYVDRMDTEKALLNMTQGGFSVDYNGNIFGFRADREALYVPTVLSKSDLTDTCYLGASGDNYVPYETYKSTFVDNVMLCDQVELTASEYSLDTIQMTMNLKRRNKVLNFDRYKLMPNGKVRICVSDLPTTLDEFDTITFALRIVNVICIGISMLCLVLTFITYCCFSTLRTLPGKNNMLLMFTVFLVQLSLLIGSRNTRIEGICITIAIASHLFWLAMFFSMNICTFHMYRVFAGTNIIVSSPNTTRVIFRSYALYVFGAPSILVAMNIVVHLGLSSGTEAGYNSKKCFLSDQESYIITFFVPIVVICLVNMCLFVVTFHKIRMAPKVQSNKANQVHFVVYGKMFVITGIIWILQVIDSFFPLSVLSFIVTILNGLQGLFIFLSYTCNKRVIGLYMQKLKHYRICLPLVKTYYRSHDSNGYCSRLTHSTDDSFSLSIENAKR